MQLWIGTSGYAFGDWVGRFYPKGTAPGLMLTYYAKHFPLVELNYTFYRVPTAQELEKLAQKSPAGFQFIVKLNRSLTHDLDLAALPAFREAVDVLKQEERLLGLLCQLPQRFHYAKASLDHLKALADHFAGHTLAVEFRHHSWNRPEVDDWLQNHRLNLVSVDVPDIPALYPRRLAHIGRLIYVRFHSRQKDRWYASDKERYDYVYSDEELFPWLQVLEEKQSVADRAFLLFNNCFEAQAAVNARRVQELLKGSATPFEVVRPFGPSLQEGEQGLLY